MSLNSRDSQLSLAEVWAMLNCIPAEDREVWLRVGMALKSEYGDAALSLYNDWSSSAHNYRESSVNEVWRSFNGQGVTMGTVVHLAEQHGYKSGPVALPQPQTKPIEKPQPSPTATYAKELWLAAARSDAFVAAHPYAILKGITWAGGAARGNASGKLIGQNADCIVVPIRNIQTDKIQGVQCINSEGVKQTFGQVSGGALVLGNTLLKNQPWYVCEGWASAFSTVFHHKSNVAACSFGKGQLKQVAERIADVYEPDEIIILKEVD